MSFVKKLKDILFDDEEETENTKVKVKEEVKEEPPKVVKVDLDEPKKEVVKNETPSERELFKSDNSFKFPDFDEEEFASNFKSVKPNANVLEYERKKTVEKRNDYGRYERAETKEAIEKKKFKPSPIISPVYGILNQDYKAEDIVKKDDNASNIDVVRKKAFESVPEVKEEKKNIFDEPVVTFLEENESVAPREKYKTIDDLLEEASEEISLDDTLELSRTNSLDAIEQELEKLENEGKVKSKEVDDSLDNDLYELIDSMYDDREED